MRRERLLVSWSLRAALLTGTLMLSACGDSEAELVESPVCDEGLPGDLAVAPPANDDSQAGDRLVLICFADTTHSEAGRVTLQQLDGQGGFSEGATRTVGRQAGHPAVADLDGDDIPDLLVANTGGLSEDHHLSLLKGQEDGSFAESETLPAVRTPFVVNDVDADGRNDLVVPGENAVLLAQEGDAGDFRRSRLPGIQTQSRRGGVVSGLNGHQRIGAIPDDETLSVHLFIQGERGKQEVKLPGGSPAIHTVLGGGDINQDQYPDLFVSVQGEEPLERSLHLVLSQDEDTWSFSDPFEDVTAMPNRLSLARDGGSGHVHVFVSPGANPEGDDEFVEHLTLDQAGGLMAQERLSVPHYVDSMIVGDFDGDDLDELVLRDMAGQRLHRLTLTQFRDDT